MSLSSFIKGRLNGACFEFLPSIDASIDWENSEIDSEEYAKDPVEGRSKVKLFDGTEPLIFVCHHLSESERLHALQQGELEINLEAGDNELPLRYCGQVSGQESGLLLGLSLAAQAAARLSIDSVKGYEENIKAPCFGRLSMVREEVLDDLAPYDLQILEELGTFVLNATKPKKKK